MTDELELPSRYQTLFTEEIRNSVYEFLKAPSWATGWKSNSRHDGHTFLHKHFAGHRKIGEKVYPCDDELQKECPFLYDAWLSVRDNIFQGHTLVRCYANGMAYGMDGTVHCDARTAGNYTAVYYPHERWSPNWGGETLFYDPEETTVVACAYPVPNSAVVFDGRIPHRANGVTRTYTGMRITLMFKTTAEKLDAGTL